VRAAQNVIVCLDTKYGMGRDGSHGVGPEASIETIKNERVKTSARA
jgi:hypothetical protein